ncbi:MAG: hypothetical protein MAG715_01071 [Methanonatronarchaeales archaeon]|nr:hypothetical protein [Methanonatronarchaeales archaeon]
MTVIGLVGRQGSGKSTVARVLRKKGFDVVSMGDVVRAEAESRGVELSEKNLGEISDELRDEHGGGVVAELLLEAGVSGDVAIDGVRSDAEVEVFREALDGFFLVAVTASRETRFERVSGRGRSDDPKSWERFVEKERREDAWGLQEAGEMADLVIENEGSVEGVAADAEKLPALASGIRVYADVAPPETVERVSRAVGTLFPTLELESDGWVRGRGFGKDLDHFRDRVFEQRITDTVRNALLEGRGDSTSTIELDRQAAMVDRVNLDVGSSLGPVRLEVSGRVGEVIDLVAPRTVKGGPEAS